MWAGSWSICRDSRRNYCDDDDGGDCGGGDNGEVSIFSDGVITQPDPLTMPSAVSAKRVNGTPTRRKLRRNSNVPLKSSLKSSSSISQNGQRKRHSWSNGRSVSDTNIIPSKMKTKQMPRLEEAIDDCRLGTQSFGSSKTTLSTTPSTCTASKTPRTSPPQRMRRNNAKQVVTVATGRNETKTVETQISPVSSTNDSDKEERERPIENAADIAAVALPHNGQAKTASSPPSDHESCKRQDEAKEKGKSIEKIKGVKKHKRSSIRSTTDCSENGDEKTNDKKMSTAVTSTTKTRKTRKVISRCRSLTPSKSPESISTFTTPIRSLSRPSCRVASKQEVPEPNPTSLNLPILDQADKGSIRSRKKITDVEGEGESRKNDNRKLNTKPQKTVAFKKSSQPNKARAVAAANRTSSSKKDKESLDGDGTHTRDPIGPPIIIEFEVQPTDDECSVITTPLQIRCDSDDDDHGSIFVSSHFSSPKNKGKKRIPLEPEGWRQ